MSFCLFLFLTHFVAVTLPNSNKYHECCTINVKYEDDSYSNYFSSISNYVDYVNNSFQQCIKNISANSGPWQFEDIALLKNYLDNHNLTHSNFYTIEITNIVFHGHFSNTTSTVWPGVDDGGDCCRRRLSIATKHNTNTNIDHDHAINSNNYNYNHIHNLQNELDNQPAYPKNQRNLLAEESVSNNFC